MSGKSDIYTLILGTHRPGNLSSVVFDYVASCFEDQHIPVHRLRMENLPKDFLYENAVLGSGGAVDEVARIHIAEASKLFFVIPEYNGSLPGILKAFIDVVKPEYFKDKKAALVGVATGRAGNLRGCDHLADVLMHLGTVVMPGALPISSLHTLLSEDRELRDKRTRDLLRAYVDRFVAF
jgi:NAD(P)H-dependent FMN reductase